MKNLYELKVAKVIDDFSVVINAGFDDEVSEGMVFLVYSLGEEVLDPETLESLGSIEIVHGRVKPDHIQQKLFTAVSIETKKITVQRRTQNALAGFFGDTEERVVKKELDGVEVGSLVRRIT